MKEINFLMERAKKYLKSAEILLKAEESSVLRTYYLCSKQAKHDLTCSER